MPTSKEFIHFTRDDGKLDMFGFPTASGKSNSDLKAFDESSIWSDPMPSVMKPKNDSHWFFDHIDDNTKVEFEPRRWGEDPEPKLKWDKKDDDLLDFLLQDDFQRSEAMPGLESVSSSEDPACDLTKTGCLADEFSNSTDSFIFDEQDFFWDEDKLFDPMQASIASTESGRDVSIEQNLDSRVEDVCDGVSAFTTSVTSQGQSVTSEEEACWYRTKIASFLAPARKFIARTEELTVRPKGEVHIPVPLLIQVPRQEPARRYLEVDVPDPLFAQGPQQELARRSLVMQQHITTQKKLEHFSKSQDETVRKYAQQRFRKPWITAHKKETKKTSCQDQCSSMASF